MNSENRSVATDQSPTWTDLWAEATQLLRNSDEARHIVEEVAGRRGTSWLITLSKPAPKEAREQVLALVERRLTGEPLQYVLGTWDFRQLHLKVDSRVLIPRPETEQVVQAAIDAVAHVSSPLVADLGTGSGAIALSLALELEDCEVWATDADSAALEVADMNLSSLSDVLQSRVHLMHGSWFEALPENMKGRFDLIVSNPPYVGEDEHHLLDARVSEWEPSQALFAGADGMDSVRRILSEVGEWLDNQGVFIAEIAPHQAGPVSEMARAGGFAEVNTGTDMAGRTRWVVAAKS